MKPTNRQKLTNKYVASIKANGKDQEIRCSKTDGLVLRVSKKGVKSFFYYYAADNKRKKYRIGRVGQYNVDTARAELERILKLTSDPQAYKIEQRANKQADKLQVLRNFLDNIYYPHIESRKSKQKSPKRTKYIMEHYFEHLMNSRLSSITKGDIEKWMDSEIERDVKNSTINRNFSAIRSVMSFAVDKGLLVDHPFKGIKKLHVIDKGVIRYLNMHDTEEETRFYKELDTRTGYFPILVRLLLNTGIRPKEAFTLEWTAVNFNLKQLTVYSAFSKTSKTRHIPLNKTIFTVLKNWKEENSGVTKGYSHVFTNPATEKPIVTVNKVWRKFLKDACIQNFRLYDCRHTFASKLAMAGVSIYEISELLGHTTVEMTKVYAHLSPEHLANAVSALD